jgi:hypothetical protein
MKKIFTFLLILIFLASCKDSLLVRYTDEEFAKENNGSIVISKGQSKTASEKTVYTVGLRDMDSTWIAYGVSKNVYVNYELGDTVKYVEPVEEKSNFESVVTVNDNSKKSTDIEKIDVTIYLKDDTLRFTNFFETN